MGCDQPQAPEQVRLVLERQAIELADAITLEPPQPRRQPSLLFPSKPDAGVGEEHTERLDIVGERLV
jgi:hypothetical protein